MTVPGGGHTQLAVLVQEIQTAARRLAYAALQAGSWSVEDAQAAIEQLRRGAGFFTLAVTAVQSALDKPIADYPPWLAEAVLRQCRHALTAAETDGLIFEARLQEACGCLVEARARWDELGTTS